MTAAEGHLLAILEAAPTGFVAWCACAWQSTRADTIDGALDEHRAHQTNAPATTTPAP